LTVYDKSAKKCCNEGTGHTCPVGKACCDGDCCDPYLCESCVDNDCKVCGGDIYKTCCYGDCCDNFGGSCTWEYPPVESTCQSVPNGTECLITIRGTICEWELVEIYNSYSAICPNCDSSCLVLQQGCARVQPHLCENMFIPFIGIVCACDETFIGNPVNVGEYYICKSTN